VGRLKSSAAKTVQPAHGHVERDSAMRDFGLSGGGIPSANSLRA